VQKQDNVQKPNTFKKNPPVSGTDGSRCGKIARHVDWLASQGGLFWYFFLTNGVAAP